MSDIEADAVLFARLAADGFRGPAYDRFLETLIRYGYQALHAWIRRGDIFAMCAAKRIQGVPRSAGWDDWTEEDINDLIQEVLEQAVTRFRRDLVAGKGWRPDGGANLTTYFAGACQFAFAAVYKRHHKVRGKYARSLAAATRRLQPSQASDIADEVADRSDATDRVNAMIPDPQLRFVMQLYADGYSHAQISALLGEGTTARGVEGMIYRCRRQLTQGGPDVR